MERLERTVARLPEAERVDIAEWGDHPTFRVRGKNFVFGDQAARELSLKLSKEEAVAVVASDPDASPTGYGLGRHGWVALGVDDSAGDERWQQIEEWGPHLLHAGGAERLARVVLEEDTVSLPAPLSAARA